MKKTLVVFLFIGMMVISSTAYAGGSACIQGETEVQAMELEEIKGLMKALSGTPNRTFHVCVLDEFGHLWEIDITGPNISGTFYPACGSDPWVVTGGHVGLNFDVTAWFVGGYNCYCNNGHEWIGTVDIQTRTAVGHAYQLDGCLGDGPATGSKVPCI